MTLLSFIFRLLISCEQRKTKERTVCVCVCVGARANFPADGAPTKHKTRLRAKDCERDALIMIIIITMMMGSDDYYTVEGRPFFLREMYGRQAPPPPVRRKRNFGKKKTFWFFFKKKKKWKSPTVQSESELRLRVRPLVNFFSPRRSDNLTGRKRKLLNENI